MSERKIPNVGTVIQALRCTQPLPPKRLHCGRCPYFLPEPEETRAAFCDKYGISPDNLLLDFADICDIDQLCMDAAELLERLTGTVGGADNGL